MKRLPMPNLNFKIALIATGGTISSKANKTSGLLKTGKINIKDLLKKSLQLLKENYNLTFNLNNFVLLNPFTIDSSAISFKHQNKLLNLITNLMHQSNISAIIVTHGTDTLEETAFYLQLTSPANKPLILTGSQFDSSNKKFDGYKNLADSIYIVYKYTSIFCNKNKLNYINPLLMGSFVVFNQRIFSSIGLQKISTTKINAFSGKEIKTSSNSFILAKKIETIVSHKLSKKLKQLKEPQLVTDSVEILYLYPDFNPKKISNLPKTIKAIILIVTGSGNTNAKIIKAVEQLIKSRKILVVVTSRVAEGKITAKYGDAGSAINLINQGAIISKHLRANQLRILLLLALSANLSFQEIKTLIKFYHLEN